MKNVEPRFIQLAEMLNDMIGGESQYSSIPKDFSMPKEVIFQTAILLQKAYNKKELTEGDNGALYYAGITEDFGGLIDLEYFKQIHQKQHTMRNSIELFIGYETYLFSCILKLFNSKFEELPYDQQFELLPIYYERFKASTYNNPNRGLYECIVDYVRNTKFFF